MGGETCSAISRGAAGIGDLDVSGWCSLLNSGMGGRTCSATSREATGTGDCLDVSDWCSLLKSGMGGRTCSAISREVTGDFLDVLGWCSLLKSGMRGRFGRKGDWGGDRAMLSGSWSCRTGDEDCGGADIDLRDLRRDPLFLEFLGRTEDRTGGEDSAPD